MAKRGTALTAAQVILLAANDLDRSKRSDFTEWELTIAAWSRDRNRFGLRGFEEAHPDHKRVMMEIMGQSKKDNPIRRGFLQKTRANYYRITDLGRAEAALISGVRSDADRPSAKSPQVIYNAIKPFIESRAFQTWLSDPEEPRSWLGASVFLGLARNTANELNDRIRALRHAVAQTERWCAESGRTEIRSGSAAGEKAISLAEIQRLPEFLSMIEQRFGRQMAALRQRD
jgi:hypothetical protein